MAGRKDQLLAAFVKRKDHFLVVIMRKDRFLVMLMMRKGQSLASGAALRSQGYRGRTVR